MNWEYVRHGKFVDTPFMALVIASLSIWYSVKLINAGKVINSHEMLSEQNLKCNGKIMTIISESSQNLAESVAQNAAYDRVQKARDDAQLLINRTKFLQVSVALSLSVWSLQLITLSHQLTDQQGNSVHVPPEEGNLIRMGLAMYEKAKVEMKKKNYSEALLFLLEADNDFKHCRSDLLESSDNGARLNLDIVWCYLCLKVSRSRFLRSSFHGNFSERFRTTTS